MAEVNTLVTGDLRTDRRGLLKGAAAMAAALTPVAATGCAHAKRDDFGVAPKWMTLLGTSEAGNRDYHPVVEGDLPKDLRGSLYRNGPGLFERGKSNIKHLLDGDGLVQRLSFSDDGVRYQNRFVATEKYLAEEKSGKREYATWTTRKSGNPLDNIGGGVTHSQGGVTVYPVHGKLLARDELGPSYEIDPQTLKTVNTIPLSDGLTDVGIKAHSKLDPLTGEWITAGTKFGRRMSVHAAIFEPNLQLKTSFSFDAPRQVYIHDFIATRSYLIFVLHPCYFNPVPFLAGFKSFTDSFSWKGEDGNLIAVIPRTGGDVRFFEASGSFMWHALNAYEENGEIVSDFIGYDTPDHFIGENALMTNLMEGRLGLAENPGQIRRHRIDLRAGALREEIVDRDNHEFPMIDGRVGMSAHNVGYFSVGGRGAFNSGVKRFDYRSGKADLYDFGPSVQVGEPVFANRSDSKLDEGWLIAQCLDGPSGRTFFAVFDAQTLGKGPVAKIWLDHHVPISFHGAWQSV